MKKIVLDEEVEIKGIKLKVKQTYYFDEKTDQYYDDEELGNENLREIRNAYRMHEGLLTDKEIREIREKYNLNQRNFSILLGFGEITITRYESKMIQEKAHDEIIRSANDPKTFYSYVLKRKDNYLKYNSMDSYQNLLKIIENKSNDDLSFSGNIAYNEEKFLALIKYYHDNIKTLTKTKLAKYLWYADFSYYKNYNKSITGLTYIHNFYGAYPIGYDEKLSNDNIIIKEKYYDKFGDYLYIIDYCNSNVELTNEEKNIINNIINKLSIYNTEELVTYMHKEDAYIKTKQNEIIKYDYAKTLSI